MSDGRVAQALSGGVLTLTLERAAKRNALDTAMVEGLHAGLERAGLNPDADQDPDGDQHAADATAAPSIPSAVADLPKA